MELTKTLKAGVLVIAVLYAATGNAKSKSKSEQVSDGIQALVSTQQKIETLGFEKALAQATWPEKPIVSAHEEQLGNSTTFKFGSNSDLPWDECNFGSMTPGCPDFPNVNPSNVGAVLKDDAIMILTQEVLSQTLTFFQVKNVFGKLKSKPNTYAFKVISPVDGQPYQDLDSDTVVYAVKQFRKYLIGLLCNQPNPSRVLAMMNRYDVGKRFRWDMAWALLGNDLPDAPNKFMNFGVKWRKFSAAMDGIENGSIMRVRNAFNGGGGGGLPGDGQWGGIVAPTTPSAAPTAGISKLGFVAREVISIIRLAGDIISAILELFCVSDLSVNSKKEVEKQTVVYKLLEVKKKAYDRDGPLRPILEDIGKKATGVSGKLVTVLP